MLIEEPSEFDAEGGFASGYPERDSILAVVKEDNLEILGKFGINLKGLGYSDHTDRIHNLVK